MHVTSLHIQDVRGFLGDEAATTLAIAKGGPGWHVFAGRNGAGKSTLLRTAALAIVGPDHARALMPSFAGWIRDGAEFGGAGVGLTRDSEDSLQGGGSLPKKSLSAGLVWTRAPEGREPTLSTSPEKPPASGKKGRLGFWLGPWGPNPRGWLVAGYGPFRRLTGHAADAQRMMVGPTHQRRLVSLFREDASLLEAVSWLQDLRFRSLEGSKAAKELLDHVIALLNDDLLPDGARVAKVDSDGLWVERGDSVIELRELSDGYRVALALIVDLVRHMHDAFGEVLFTVHKGKVSAVMPGVVLIDEVDAHLHVSWQQRIGFWLTERFPRLQFLVTTHSPFVCQAAVPGGLFRMPSPGEERGVEPVSEDTYRSVVNGTVNDAVLSSLFGMERTRSPRAEALTEEWSRLRAKESRHALSRTERARFNELTDQLPLPFERKPEPQAAE
jgi:hypothetical protein